MTSNHPPPNHESCLPKFFPRNFVSWAVEKENKLFIGPKLRKKNLFWTNKKFIIFFNSSNWEKLGKTKLFVWWIDVTNWLYDRRSKLLSDFLGNLFQLLFEVGGLLKKYGFAHGWKMDSNFFISLTKIVCWLRRQKLGAFFAIRYFKKQSYQKCHQ